MLIVLTQQNDRLSHWPQMVCGWIDALPPALVRVVLHAVNQNLNDCRGQSYHNLWVGEGFAVGSWTAKKVRRIRKICGKGRVSPGIGLHKSSVPTAIPSVGFADSSPC